MKRRSTWLYTLAVLAVQLGACQDRGTSLSGAGEVVSSEHPSLTGLEKVLRHRMDQLGLTEADLAEAPRAKDALARWRQARAAGDVEAARAAHRELVSVLPGLASDPALLPLKLTRVQAQLTAHAAELPDAQREALEAHVRELAARVGAPDADRASVALALTVVERQLRNLD